MCVAMLFEVLTSWRERNAYNYTVSLKSPHPGLAVSLKTLVDFDEFGQKCQ